MKICDFDGDSGGILPTIVSYAVLCTITLIFIIITLINIKAFHPSFRYSVLGMQAWAMTTLTVYALHNSASVKYEWWRSETFCGLVQILQGIASFAVFNSLFFVFLFQKLYITFQVRNPSVLCKHVLVVKGHFLNLSCRSVQCPAMTLPEDSTFISVCMYYNTVPENVSVCTYTIYQHSMKGRIVYNFGVSCPLIVGKWYIRTHAPLYDTHVRTRTLVHRVLPIDCGPDSCVTLFYT